MDKEKEIEEFAFSLIGATSPLGVKDLTKQFDYKTVAEYLINAGYGNVEQAVKEFADYARQVIVKQFSDTEMEKIKTVGALQLLYNKIEELYGEE